MFSWRIFLIDNFAQSKAGVAAIFVTHVQNFIATKTGVVDKVGFL